MDLFGYLSIIYKTFSSCISVISSIILVADMEIASLSMPLTPQTSKKHLALDHCMVCHNMPKYHKSLRHYNTLRANIGHVLRVCENSKFNDIQSAICFPSGLTMEIFIDQDEYVPLIADTAGIRVDIHDQEATPLPYDKGISVEPGTATAVSLIRVR